MVITSSDNPTFKKLKSLQTAKGRARHGLCIVEGEKIIFENLELVDQIFLREDIEVTPNLADMQPIILSKKLFNEISDLETSPGIFATAQIPLTAKQSGRTPLAPTLILDRIQDAGNMGTLLRTAAAFGFNNILTINCVSPFSQKVLRAGMGNQFLLNISEASFEDIKKIANDFELIIADMNGTPLNETPLLNGNFALVLGNEGQGISKELLDLPHAKITIPMQPGTESLNVAAAGAILMYELKKGG